MSSFQGSGFSISLPEAVIDASSYCFSFPSAGTLSPNLTIKCDTLKDKPDLSVVVNERTAQLSESLENLIVISEVANTRDSWEYIVSVVEWGATDNRTRQKQLFIYVPGEKPRLFTLVGTDLASNYQNSEPLFDQIIKTFNSNDIQVL
jgi:hypothetical protein